MLERLDKTENLVARFWVALSFFGEKLASTVFIKPEDWSVGRTYLKEF